MDKRFTWNMEMLQMNLTICITSFNRFPLLSKTITTIKNFSNAPIIVVEDSGNTNMERQIKESFPDITLLFNQITIGQTASIDKMYSLVQTPYIWHSEDDYLYEGNPNAISEAIQLLEENKTINQVHLRKIADIQNQDQFEKDILTSSTGIKYKMFLQDYNGWCGFSFYSHIKRLEDYKKMFPNGYKEFMQPNWRTSGVQTEAACNTNARLQGYRGAILLDGIGIHKGINGLQAYK